MIARPSLVLALLCAGRVGHADTPTSNVTVTLNAQGEQLAQGLGDSEAELVQKVHDKIDALYQLENIGALLHAFGNAAVAANRGFGVDYAIRAHELELGVAVTGAFAGGPLLGASNVAAGDIVSFGGSIGANLERWGVPRVAVFANVGYTSATIDELAGHLTTVGAHARVEAMRPRGHWIGVAVTSGVEISHAALAATHGGLTEHFTVVGNTPGESRNLTLDATGTLDLVATTVTFPLIVTTGVRAGAFAAYAGGGLDLIAGGSTLTAGLAGTLAITDNKTQVGALQITASGSDSVTAAALRGLAGVSVQAWHVNIYAQGDISQTANAVTLGLRATL